MSSPLECPLPVSIQAERAVLGSLLIDPEMVSEVAVLLVPEDFYRLAHQRVYAAILHLSTASTAADYLTVCDLLEQREQLEEVGGASALASLVDDIPTSSNAVFYAHIVRRTATQRALIAACHQIIAQAYAEVEEEAHLVEQAEQRLFAIGQRLLHGEQEAPLSALLASYFEVLDQRYQQRGLIVGVPSGFHDLDALTGGFHPSDLIVLAGRPSSGKTALFLSMAFHAAVQQGYRVGVFSLEMSPLQLVERLLARAAPTSTHRLRMGLVEEEEWELLVASIDHLSRTATMRIDGTSLLSPMQLRMRARRWMAQEGIDIIFVDYLQLMQADAQGRGRGQENRVQVIDEITRSLKLLARELHVPIVCLAQLSRAVEQRASKVPQLSDLRESSSIEMNADLVMLLYREEMYDPKTEHKHQADLLVAKHRNGPCGQIRLAFDPETTSFADLPTLLSMESDMEPEEEGSQDDA